MAEAVSFEPFGFRISGAAGFPSSKPSPGDVLTRAPAVIICVRCCSPHLLTTRGSRINPQFQAGKMHTKLPLASIEDISVGTETTQAGGRAGTVAKTAAIAAPYDSGAALSILLRTRVDTLTVSNRDSSGMRVQEVLLMVGKTPLRHDRAASRYDTVHGALELLTSAYSVLPALPKHVFSNSTLKCDLPFRTISEIHFDEAKTLRINGLIVMDSC